MCPREGTLKKKKKVQKENRKRRGSGPPPRPFETFHLHTLFQLVLSFFLSGFVAVVLLVHRTSFCICFLRHAQEKYVASVAFEKFVIYGENR